jgi:hypothetical protein
VLDLVAILDRWRLFELLHEFLLPQQQVLYDCTHGSPTPEANVASAREPGPPQPLHQNVHDTGWFLRMNWDACGGN